MIIIIVDVVRIHIDSATKDYKGPLYSISEYWLRFYSNTKFSPVAFIFYGFKTLLRAYYLFKSSLFSQKILNEGSDTLIYIIYLIILFIFYLSFILIRCNVCRSGNSRRLMTGETIRHGSFDPETRSRAASSPSYWTET